jgi:transcriptional regulator with XRE-family HTH domain
MTSKLTFRLRHNLATLLKERNLTAAQLSRKTGVAKQVLSDWLSGVQPRKIEHLYVVSRELGTSIETICFSQSDAELLAGLSASHSARTRADGSSFLAHDTFSPAVLFSQNELKGRFDIYVRRITD